jgi:hypothetical protein
MLVLLLGAAKAVRSMTKLQSANTCRPTAVNHIWIEKKGRGNATFFYLYKYAQVHSQ